jgi:hypothetical protein
MVHGSSNDGRALDSGRARKAEAKMIEYLLLRAPLLIYWFLRPQNVTAAIHSRILQVLGLTLLPLFTFVFVLVGQQGIHGLGWLWISLGLAADVGAYLFRQWLAYELRYGGRK